MPKFHATLKDPGSEQRRYVTISRVPCPKCENHPILRGGFFPTATSKTRTPVCPECDGRGEVEASKDSAVAHLEALEREYEAFRLDDPLTFVRYKDTMPEDALERVMETTVFVPKDTHTVNGFHRAGKVLRVAHPDYVRQYRGWRAFHEQEKPYKVERIGLSAEKLAVTGGQFGVPLKNMFAGSNVWDWDTDTIKLALTTSTYTVDIDTHDFFNDVTNEITGTNYTAGGWTLTASAPSYDTATDQVRLDATDVSQASATFTARKAVVYKSTGTSSTSPLISYLDFGADVSPSAGTFSITFDSTGVVVYDVT
jgi:hypothetical protein